MNFKGVNKYCLLTASRMEFHSFFMQGVALVSWQHVHKLKHVHVVTSIRVAMVNLFSRIANGWDGLLVYFY